VTISTREKKSRARTLAALVEARLPADFDVHGDEDAWSWVATGLLARQAGTMLSLVDLEPSGRVTDLAVLVRDLFEHVVHLAWLGADPGRERVEAWRKHDLSERLKADRDATDHGVLILTAEERAEMERERGALTGGRLKLIDLAVAADQRWLGVLPGFDIPDDGDHDDAEESEDKEPDRQSFRKLYAIVYRHTSAFAHPSWRGLHRVTIDTGPTGRRVAMEQADRAYPFDPVGLGTLIFATGLFVAGEALGWPEREQVVAIFNRFPGDPRTS
jgi:Family of unknown function (DUF5677)